MSTGGLHTGIVRGYLVDVIVVCTSHEYGVGI